MRLPELGSEDWRDDDDWLTIDETALLEARLSADLKDPDAGSSWEEVEDRIEPALIPGRTVDPPFRVGLERLVP